MRQFAFLHTLNFYPGSGIMRRHMFKTANVGDHCALLATENHPLAMNFAITRGRSAHFQMDCFECLSPHETAA